MQLKKLKKDLRSFVDREKAEVYPKFFKTGPGEYGEGDKFIGVTVPNCRSVAKKYTTISQSEIKDLLKSKIHEERLVALLILVSKFQKANNAGKKSMYNFYLANTRYINNWDLVDLSSTKIVGEYLQNKSKSVLTNLAKSKNIWERRIAIVSTYSFIKKGNIDTTLKISSQLLRDKHDLIHKAVGWMLREVGKKDEIELEKFLRTNYNNIPRTTLRYAIERFAEKKRRKFLQNNLH